MSTRPSLPPESVGPSPEEGDRPARPCVRCSLLVPRDYPRDPVILDGVLSPFDAVRHLEALTEIVHGKLSSKHGACLAIASAWLQRVRAVQKTVRVAGVDRGIYEGWVRLLREARQRLEGELQRREQTSEAADRAHVRRAVRQAMNAVGWEDFGLDVDAEGRNVQIFYPLSERPQRESSVDQFRNLLSESLGERAAGQLDIRYRTVGR